MSKYIVMNFRDYKNGEEANNLCLVNTNGSTDPEYFDWDDEIVISDPMNWYEGEIVSDDQFVYEGEMVRRTA
jgi:hypothetical protein